MDQALSFGPEFSIRTTYLMTIMNLFSRSTVYEKNKKGFEETNKLNVVHYVI